MAVLYDHIEIPEEIKRETSSENASNVARFVATPFERGYGHTIGNSLRRMLLTSIEAPAIVSVRMEGVPHEYMPIPNVIEDMTTVVLNLKGALLRRLSTESQGRDARILTKRLEVSQEMIDAGGGQHFVTLGEIIDGPEFEIVNPEHHLFTVTKPLDTQIDLRVLVGRGYVPSERHVVEDKIENEIFVDSCFSPVRLVNYFVENTRVGQHTDFDKLILDIETDGRVTPEEALSFVAQIGVKHLEVFTTIQEERLQFEIPGQEGVSDRDVMMQKFALRINEIELSVRSTNCLQGADIETIAELVIKPESAMLKFRNFGKKSLHEIKNKLTEMGLSLGMDLSKYSINEENVRSVIAAYLEEQQGS